MDIQAILPQINNAVNLSSNGIKCGDEFEKLLQQVNEETDIAMCLCFPHRRLLPMRLHLLSGKPPHHRHSVYPLQGKPAVSACLPSGFSGNSPVPPLCEPAPFSPLLFGWYRSTCVGGALTITEECFERMKTDPEWEKTVLGMVRKMYSCTGIMGSKMIGYQVIGATPEQCHGEGIPVKDGSPLSTAPPTQVERYHPLTGIFDISFINHCLYSSIVISSLDLLEMPLSYVKPK